MNDLYLRPPLPFEPEMKHQSVSKSHMQKSYETVNSSHYLSSTSLASNAVSDYMSFSCYKENFPNISDDYESYPRVLHIPGSITCQNDFSWGFWNWIHSKDNVQQNDVYRDRSPSEDETIFYTKIFTQDGTPFYLKPSYDHHSKHFHIERNFISTPRSEAIANQNNSLNNYMNHRSNDTHITDMDKMMYKGGTIDLKNQMNTRNGIDTRALSGANAVKELTPTTVPRFYIQVMNFKGEHFNNVSYICCSIEINNKKVFTGVAPCIKNSDGTVTANFNEAFVFDVTSSEFTISISVYGLYHKTLNKSFIKNIKETLNIKTDNKAIKPSYTGVFRNYHLNNNDLSLFANNVTGPRNSTLNKSISIISNTFSLKKSKKESTKNPMDNIDMMGKEIFIGDYEIHFTTQKLDKTTGTYKLNPVLIPNKQGIVTAPNSKYQQNIVLQTGIYLDEKVKQTVAYINENIFCDYLNVQLSTTTVPVWKRYWVIFKENFLTFYDFEYKEKKEPIGKIDIHTLKSVGLPNPEYNSMPNCFCIEFEEDKDLADIVGVYQKEGDYNEKDEEEEISNKKYERIKPKEELLLKKKEQIEVDTSHSNINSNNTLYSSKKEELNEIVEEKEEKDVEESSVIIKEDVEEDQPKVESTGEKKEGEAVNSLDNVAINIDTIENMIKNISIDVNSTPSEATNSNNTLHQQQCEKIPHYEWINRVVTKSTASFYADSAPKMSQWIKAIEESPCFQITK